MRPVLLVATGCVGARSPGDEWGAAAKGRVESPNAGFQVLESILSDVQSAPTPV